MSGGKGLVRVMSMTDPASLAIAQDILRDNWVPFVVQGATSESVMYGPGNVAFSTALLVEERYVPRALELLDGLNGVLRTFDRG